METYHQLKQLALRLLTSRDHSEHELRQKLTTKANTQHIIEVVLAEIHKAGLLNDKHFAENFIHSRRKRGYGPLRISKELEMRGIPTTTIAELIKITDNAWLIDVRNVWQKRFKSKKPSDFKERVKQMRFLQYRGFTQEQIESVFIV